MTVYQVDCFMNEVYIPEKPRAEYYVDAFVNDAFPVGTAGAFLFECPFDGERFDWRKYPWPPNAVELPPAYAFNVRCPVCDNKLIAPLVPKQDGLVEWPKNVQN